MLLTEPSVFRLQELVQGVSALKEMKKGELASQLNVKEKLRGVACNRKGNIEGDNRIRDFDKQERLVSECVCEMFSALEILKSKVRKMFILF